MSQLNNSSIFNASTSLMSVQCSNRCDIDYSKIIYKINNDKVIGLNIWEPSGHEKYNSLSKNFYQNTQMAILMYDITNQESFKKVDFWLNHLKNNCETFTKYALVGNKTDLSSKRKVLAETGSNYSLHNKFDLFCEISANTGNGINFLFQNIAKLLYSQIIDYQKYLSTSSGELAYSSILGNNDNTTFLIGDGMNKEFKKEIEKINKQRCSC